MISGSRKTGHPAIREIAYRSLAHAYVIRREFARIIVRQAYCGIPFDTMLKNRGGRFFATYPSFAYQGGMPTENTNRIHLDRWRSRMGGLGRIQKANMWYHENKTAVIAAHVAAATAILLRVLL